MLKSILRAVAQLRNDGDSSLSIPVFDGAYRPNNLLEEAHVFAQRAEIEDIAAAPDGSLLAACASEVVRFLPDGESVRVADFGAPVQALATWPDGALVVAAMGAVIVRGGASDSARLASVDGADLSGVNALHVTGSGTVLISDGSKGRGYAQWSRDLLERGRTGRLIEFDPGTGRSRVVVDNLAYCFGVGQDADRTFVSESWAHRIVAVEAGLASPILDRMPGYPARMCAAAKGGWWLSLFAGRTQLVEFVLAEDDYREEMMRTVAPEYWVSPAMRSGADFLEPLQIGGVKQMGVLKPWAPPRSYGLLVRLNERMQPIYSLHSRVGCKNHGIVAAVECGDELYVLSKGAGRILRLSVPHIERRLDVRRGAT